MKITLEELKNIKGIGNKTLDSIRQYLLEKETNKLHERIVLEDYNNKIVCEDNVKVLKGLPNNVVDLTITSPPYDELRDYEGFSFDFKAVVQELYRITKDGGIIVWIVNDSTINGSETGTSFKQALYFMNFFLLHDTMIWRKPSTPFPESNRYYQCFEYMFVFSKGKPNTTNLIADRKNKYGGDKVARKHGERQKDGKVASNSAYRNEPDRKIKKYGVRFNVWNKSNSSHEQNKLALLHPASFPEGLIKDHVLSWSNERDLVLDPFNGSGTTTKVAKNLGRNYLGIDISQKYCEIAEKRLKD